MRGGVRGRMTATTDLEADIGTVVPPVGKSGDVSTERSERQTDR